MTDNKSSSMNKPAFIDGLFAKKPHDNAPDFVKAKLSIKREDMIKWLNEQQDEWINLDVKESKEGKWYCAIDDWKPKKEWEGREEAQAAVSQPVPEPQSVDVDTIPF